MESFRLFNFKSIKGKLVLYSIFAVACLLISLGYCFSVVMEFNDHINVLTRQRIPIEESLASLRSSTHAIPRYLWLSHASEPKSEARESHIKDLDDHLVKFKEALDHLVSYQLTKESQEIIKRIQVIYPSLEQILNHSKDLLRIGSKEKDENMRLYVLEKMNPITLEITAETKSLGKIADERNTKIINQVNEKMENTKGVLMVLSIALSLVIVAIGWIFSLRLSNQFSQITESVSLASQQVSSASEQLSSSSEVLSSAAQQQSSSIEQTSSSLTEVSSMVDANSKDAEKAHSLARSVHSVSEETKNFMDELSKAMENILSGNTKIEKLVKVIQEIGDKTEIIDEIVFKTQLLSFNASIEAERAGEHGRGFAVVAQEVGNLAQMSGKAAQEISSIVKGSIKEAESVSVENKTMVESGSKLALQTKEQMNKVLGELSIILEIMNKIVMASKEQSQGVSQISASVDSLSHTTQETASTSQESASASVELSAQAQSLLTLVEQLREVVFGESTKMNEGSERLYQSHQLHQIHRQRTNRRNEKNNVIELKIKNENKSSVKNFTNINKISDNKTTDKKVINSPTITDNLDSLNVDVWDKL